MWRWTLVVLALGALGLVGWRTSAGITSVPARVAPVLRFARSLAAEPSCDVTVRGSTSGANATIARVTRRLRHRFVLCLAGTFRGPLVIEGKHSTGLLVVEGEPGHGALIAPTSAARLPAVGVDGLNAAIEVRNSSGVELRGLEVVGPVGDGPGVTPTGILVEDDGPRACGTAGCHDVALVDDVVRGVANLADADASECGNGNVDAFGITVLDPSRGAGGALRGVVIEGSRVADTRTGASEMLSLNGNVEGFLVRGNRVLDGDNIGIDLEGGYGGSAPARDGLVEDNLVANVDSLTNVTAGSRRGGRCVPQENAAGIYDDGARDVGIVANRVDDTNQGISLDAEVPGATSSGILVVDNVVRDLPGTSAGAHSAGRASGVPASDVAGHAYDAFYVDTFGRGSTVEGVLALANRFVNLSQHFLPGQGYGPVAIAVGGRSRAVGLCDDAVGTPKGGTVQPLAIGSRTQGVVVEQLRRGGGTRVDSAEYHGAGELPAGAGSAVCRLLVQRLGGAVKLAQWYARN